MKRRGYRSSIFISATSKGFGEWRDHVRLILEKQGFEPAVQESFEPEALVVQEIVEEKISRASGVISLIGPYYGWPLQLEDEGNNLSFTQYEWFYAQRRRKPMRVYVTGEGFFGGEIEREDDDQSVPNAKYFAQWQQEFRQHVMQNKHAYRVVKTPVELALALARINWREWPE